MKESNKLMNFRIQSKPLQEDQSLMICKVCNTYCTQSTSSPYCTKFIEEYFASF